MAPEMLVPRPEVITNSRKYAVRMAVLAALLPAALAARNASDNPAKHIAGQTPSAAAANWEMFRDIVIAPGKSIVLDSAADFSTVNLAAVSFKTASGSPSDLSKLTMQAYWSIPEADQYNATEARRGSDATFANSGGVLFEVFGSQFRMVIGNDGELDIKLQQVIVFRRAP